MAVQLPDDLFEKIRLEKYGLGVPAVLAGLGFALLYRSIGGMVIYYQMNIYGKIGVVTLLSGAALCLWLSGYTYGEVDTGQWLMSEEEDKAELIEDG